MDTKHPGLVKISWGDDVDVTFSKLLAHKEQKSEAEANGAFTKKMKPWQAMMPWAARACDEALTPFLHKSLANRMSGV